MMQNYWIGIFWTGFKRKYDIDIIIIELTFVLLHYTYIVILYKFNCLNLKNIEIKNPMLQK